MGLFSYLMDTILLKVASGIDAKDRADFDAKIAGYKADLKNILDDIEKRFPPEKKQEKKKKTSGESSGGA